MNMDMKKIKYFTPEKWLEDCKQFIGKYGSEFHDDLIKEGCLIWGYQHRSIIAEKIHEMRQNWWNRGGDISYEYP